MQDDFCGTRPWPWPRPWPPIWWLGKLDAAKELLTLAGALSSSAGNSGNPDIRGYVQGAHAILTSMENAAEHCSLREALEEGTASTAELIRMLDAGQTGPDFQAALKISIKIIIKIGRVTITIEF